MSYWADAYEDNPIHAAEREEARDARRFQSLQTTCHGGHDMKRTPGGGGVCVDCGETVSGDEL